MYEFYINEVLLPVTPSALSIKIKNQNKTVNLADGTKFNIIKLPGLSEISFDCLLPNVKYPFAHYENDEFKNSDYYIGLFEDLKINKTNFYFRVLRSENVGGTELECTLEDYTIKEDAENGFDFKVTIKLKQYTPKKTEVISFTGDKKSTAVVETQRPISKSPEDIIYTVASGDTLWGLAKRYYGDGTKYTIIYDENKEVIENTAKQHGYESSSNGRLIYPDTKLLIKNGIN